MKALTVSEIMNFNPCYTQEQIESLFESAGYANKAAPLEVILSAPIPIKDIFWLVLRKEILEEKTLHEIAIFAAELVLPIFEKKYPDDDRPRKAIEAKKSWLEGAINDKELKAAASAAYAAASAYAAYDAASDAYAAASAASAAAAYDASAAAAASNKIASEILCFVCKQTKNEDLLNV